MAKRLATNGRHKIEKEICQKLSILSDNTAECEEYIVELEALLRQRSNELNGAQSALVGSESRLADAINRIDGQKEELQVLRTDAKLAAMQQTNNDKELLQLQAQLDEAFSEGQAQSEKMRLVLDAEKKSHAEAQVASERQLAKLASELQAEKSANAEANKTNDARFSELSKEFEDKLNELAKANKDLAQLREEMGSLHITLEEYRECDKALRERILTLEKMLADERKKAGQDLLLRIMELETMLEAERNKVDDLEELPTVVHVSHSSSRVPKKTTVVKETTSTKEVRRKASK